MTGGVKRKQKCELFSSSSCGKECFGLGFQETLLFFYHKGLPKGSHVVCIFSLLVIFLIWHQDH